MFTVTQEPFGPFTLYKLLNQETGEYAAVVPGYGAVLHQLALLSHDDQLVELIQGFETGEQLARDGSRYFRGNLLFPFPNRIREGKYTFDGKNYQLPVNETGRGHALHGNLYDAAFDVVAEGASATGAFLILQYDGEGKAEGYPFQYILNLDFRLTEQGFSCKAVVQNEEDREIPLGIGFHPYFKLDTPVDNLLLKLPVRTQLELDERMIPTGKETAPEHFTAFTPLKNVALDHAFAVTEEGGKVVTELVDPARNLKLQVWQRTGARQYNFLQVYTPETRDSIAIEPMTCAPDAFNNGKGLILLKPGEVAEADYGVQLS